VVEEFISYIAHTPTDSTAPLYLELNTADMLTAQGGPDKVRIYDANAQEGNSPYVKLSDSGRRENLVTFMNGGSYVEKQWVTCECVALGSTALSAVRRAELLKLAIEGFVKVLQSDLSGLNARLDLGGTGSNEEIKNVYIDYPTQQPLVTGQDGKFTASRTAFMLLWVSNLRQR
jgi:hypothetical protein